jgi:hypothetical protein
MPVNFRRERLAIRTFRGVRALDLELPHGAPVVLIGANNAGKSTILDALSIVLGGPGSYNFVPNEYDFFHDATGTAAESFEITVSFAADSPQELPAVRGGYGDPVAVHGARVSAKTDRKGRHEHETRLIGEDREVITLPVSIPLKGATKDKWKEHGLSFRMRNARWSEISDCRPDVWLLRPDNLYASLYQWKTGPLQRLASLLARTFFESSWTFEYEGTQSPTDHQVQWPVNLETCLGKARSSTTRSFLDRCGCKKDSGSSNSNTTRR